MKEPLNCKTACVAIIYNIKKKKSFPINNRNGLDIYRVQTVDTDIIIRKYIRVCIKMIIICL